MPELNELQIDLVSAYIKQHGVAQNELHEDLLDHVCTSIEEKIGQGDSFEAAFQHTIALFGPGGFKQVQQQTFELLTEINETMKKATFFFGLTSTILLLAGTIFKLQHWPGAGIMIVLGAVMLSLIYLPIILRYKLKESPKNEAVMHVSGFIGMALTTLGALFKIQHWPGASVLLLSGIAVLAFAYVPIYFYKKYQTSVNKPITLSASLVAMTCLILVFALTRMNNSHSYDEGITLINDKLEASAMIGSNDLRLASKLNGRHEAIELTEASEELITYLEDMKVALISSVDGISISSATSRKLADVRGKANVDAPTEMIFSAKDDVYSEKQLADRLNAYRSMVLATYPMAVRSDVEKLFGYNLSETYTHHGEDWNWIKHSFYKVPTVGVISQLSKLQSDIRQSENQALLFMISQPAASEPPS